AWQEHVPPDLTPRTALAGFRRGVLEVHVTDSASLYQVDRLLRGGLQQRLADTCRSPLRKVRLRVVPASIHGPPASRR
ncbi:MAG: DUF721 domain-containing protein, partial [Phycisphaerae bacterium]|nr:DUF721 domain-containing protein [Phycisphaerae bacterium]